MAEPLSHNSENKFEQAALAYLRLGWSVIPLRYGEKVPTLAWQVFQHRRAEEDEIRSWFKRWGRINLGIVTGPISGLVVLDIDPRHGGEGEPCPLDRTPRHAALYRRGADRRRRAAPLLRRRGSRARQPGGRRPRHRPARSRRDGRGAAVPASLRSALQLEGGTRPGETGAGPLAGVAAPAPVARRCPQRPSRWLTGAVSCATESRRASATTPSPLSRAISCGMASTRRLRWSFCFAGTVRDAAHHSRTTRSPASSAASRSCIAGRSGEEGAPHQRR